MKGCVKGMLLGSCRLFPINSIARISNIGSRGAFRSIWNGHSRFPAIVTPHRIKPIYPISRRWNSTEPTPTPIPMGPEEDPSFHKGIVWFDNMFPFKYPLIDPRKYFIDLYSLAFMQNESYKSFLPYKFPPGCEFIVDRAQENLKEGGLFIEFRYKGGTVEEAVELIQDHLNQNNSKQWFKVGKVNAFQVKGTPWVEDLISRVPSAKLAVKFIGPDLTVESLYREFRVFGRIRDIQSHNGMGYVEFLRKQSATSAKNCIHGEVFNGTKLIIGYEKQQGWYSSGAKWFNANLKISVPLLLAVMAGISFVVFDPLRVWFVTNQITERYYFSKLGISAYESSMAIYERILRSIFPKRPVYRNGSNELSERKEIAKKLEDNLKHIPDSVFLVNGPKGSGKTLFMNNILKNIKYKLVIQCDELIGKGDYMMLSVLSSQVNFFPTFGFLTQVSGFIDAMITATTGTKANFATTNDGEIQKVLEAVTRAVENITETQVKKRQKQLQSLANTNTQDAKEVSIPDVVYPVIVIDGFLGKENIREHYIYNVLAQWASQLAEQRIAHVVFVSDSPSSQQLLGKTFMTKSIELYTLRDATPSAAIEYMRKRLGSKAETINWNKVSSLTEKLGGRYQDLDMFVSKIQTGMKPELAFEELVSRAVVESRKLGFSDNQEKPKWSPIQFWKIAQLLAKRDSILFDELCVDPIFDTDAKPILEMERSGLIAILQENGRPFTVTCGRPLYRLAFKQMMDDPKLVAYESMLTAKKLYAYYTSKIQTIESELLSLTSISKPTNATSIKAWLFGDGVQERRDFLINTLRNYSTKAAKYFEDSEKFKKQLKLE